MRPHRQPYQRDRDLSLPPALSRGFQRTDADSRCPLAYLDSQRTREQQEIQRRRAKKLRAHEGCPGLWSQERKTVPIRRLGPTNSQEKS
jgi:hypothetical protein